MRNAGEHEVGPAIALIREAYREFGRFVSAEFAEMFEADAADVKGRAPYADLIVAERSGRLVGTVTFYRDGSGYGEGWPTGWAALRLLAVAPSARGRGIGRALTSECIRRAQATGCSAIGLHTMSFMQDARRLYEKMGFQRRPGLDLEYMSGFPVMGYLLNLGSRSGEPNV